MAPLDSDTALTLLARLHAHKNAGYGDAWRKRGEVLSIFANLARKYDRLVVSLDHGVRSGDERIPGHRGRLYVYTAKYLTWLAERAPDAFNIASSVSARDCADQGGPRHSMRYLRRLIRKSAMSGSVGRLSREPSGARGGAHRPKRRPRSFRLGERVTLTWKLAASPAGLLLAFGAESKDEVESWRAEIEAMG
jgi:hypothetical protein